MDFSTRYLGLTLKNPLILGASPLAHDRDAVCRAVDAGAAAVVMHSLFEEQLTAEEVAHDRHAAPGVEEFAEASSWLPSPAGYALGPAEYLEHLARLKRDLPVPVIGSLNGVTARGWLRYAKQIEEAGADALELNVYQLATDPDEGAEAVESRILAMVAEIGRTIAIPLAVKLSPFHTALAHFARRLTDAGVAGLVVFNRFYQPDIDVAELEVHHRLQLSTSSELLLRLRWLAILHGRCAKSLAVTGGVHDATDVVKAIMAGADAVQTVSGVLRHGPAQFATLLGAFESWLSEHEYESVAQMRGSMSLLKCPDPSAYERANYIQMLQSWPGRER
ncbi:MAG: dihydroorotate dehydrogenase-like protein [Myxococcales bacterium]|nr:dihydroorotate dehydrogenase-like protein [Myxococcales bacterium]